MHSHGLLGVVIMPHSTVCSFVTFLTAVGPPCPLCQECAGWRQHEHQDLQCGLLRHDLWEQRLHHEVASPRNPLWSDCHYIQRCVSQRYLHCSRCILSLLNMCMHVLQILLACNGKYVDQLWPMLNVLQVVVWCGTVGAGDCGGYPLWGDSAWGPLLTTHERNENALSSALRPRNVSVTYRTYCVYTLPHKLFWQPTRTTYLLLELDHYLRLYYFPCSHELMLDCWRRNPVDRPHFSVIHEKLEDLANSKVVSSSAHSVVL